MQAEAGHLQPDRRARRPADALRPVDRRPDDRPGRGLRLLAGVDQGARDRHRHGRRHLALRRRPAQPQLPRHLVPERRHGHRPHRAQRPPEPGAEPALPDAGRLALHHVQQGQVLAAAGARARPSGMDRRPRAATFAARLDASRPRHPPARRRADAAADRGLDRAACRARCRCRRCSTSRRRWRTRSCTSATASLDYAYPRRPRRAHDRQPDPRVRRRRCRRQRRAAHGRAHRRAAARSRLRRRGDRQAARARRDRRRLGAARTRRPDRTPDTPPVPEPAAAPMRRAGPRAARCR